MAFSRSFIYAALVILLGILARWDRSRKPPGGTKVPPCPKNGLLIVGHAFQIPPFHSWLKFKTWTDELGPIVGFRIFGRENIVISSEKIANNLLRERGTIYSSREHLTMAADYLSGNLRPLLLDYNDRWRRGRKLMHRLTMASAATSYQPMQLLESTRMLYDLLRDPSQYELWFHRYASGLIFRIGYGKAIRTGKEEHAQRILEVVHTVERIASPGSYLVDSLPFLKYLPEWMAPFKREGRRLHERELNLFRTLLRDVQAEVEQEARAGAMVPAPPSFARTWLESKDAFGLTEDEAAYVLGTLFEAGSGTTAAAMMSFILAVVLFPKWQQAMFEELDRTVGGSRMPEFQDIPNLPVSSVTAGGVPHQLVVDDVYNGYFFPKGTTVHANQWAIHRDPELYPDPETFNPDRWLNPSYPTYREPLDKYPCLQNFSAFGFGRRICPGMNIAENSLHLLPARVIWACKISKRKGPDGVGITPPLYDYTTGFNTQPRPFEFDLVARSEEKRAAVEVAFGIAQASDPLASTVDYTLGHSLCQLGE
ncbi:cytochrome P450 [Aspergillus keveii]|uniref:Cytochrome P450 n=1 Tax=Aspergillus keveii TaxID=714993 RepID=A0ABR4GIJ3_9EURO